MTVVHVVRSYFFLSFLTFGLMLRNYFKKFLFDQFPNLPACCIFLTGKMRWVLEQLVSKQHATLNIFYSFPNILLLLVQLVQ